MKYLTTLFLLTFFCMPVSAQISRSEFNLCQHKVSKSSFGLVSVEQRLDALEAKVKALEQRCANCPTVRSTPVTEAPQDVRPTRPDGDGWQWDGKQWWRYGTRDEVQPHQQFIPLQQPIQMQPSFGFGMSFGADCVGGT